MRPGAPSACGRVVRAGRAGSRRRLPPRTARSGRRSRSRSQLWRRAPEFPRARRCESQARPRRGSARRRAAARPRAVSRRDGSPARAARPAGSTRRRETAPPLQTSPRLRRRRRSRAAWQRIGVAWISLYAISRRFPELCPYRLTRLPHGFSVALLLIAVPCLLDRKCPLLAQPLCKRAEASERGEGRGRCV